MAVNRKMIERNEHKFMPWFWFFGLPILNPDRKNYLYESTNNEKVWRKYISIFLMVAFSGSFGVGMIIIFIFYDLELVRLNIVGDNIGFILNILLTIGSVVLASCVGTVVWAYLMKVSNFISVEQIEIISRPFMQKKGKTG